jgi:hypothetical protein
VHDRGSPTPDLPFHDEPRLDIAPTLTMYERTDRAGLRVTALTPFIEA